MPSRVATQLHAHGNPNCPAGPLMRKINEMPTDGEAWEIKNVSGYTTHGHHDMEVVQRGQ